MRHQNSTQNIVDLGTFLAEREAATSFVPITELPPRQFEIHKHASYVKTRSFIGRMVITEPLDTSEHLLKPAIIIGHGYMAAEPAYDDLAAEFASRGYRVAHGPMTRLRTPCKRLHSSSFFDPIKTQSQILDGYAKAMNQRYPESPQRHHFVGHSLGGLAVSRLLYHRPEAFESAVLLASAGTTEHGFLQMAGRGIKAIRDEIIPYSRNVPRETRARIALHSLFHIVSGPITLLAEGYHAAKGDALIGVRHGRDHNVPVGMLCLTNDTFFPLEETTDEVKAEFDAHRISVGNHLAPQEDMRYTSEEVLHLINALTATASMQEAN